MKKVFIAFGAVVLTAAAVFAGRESVRKATPTDFFVQKTGVCKIIGLGASFTGAVILTTTAAGNTQVRLNTRTSGLSEYPLFQNTNVGGTTCNTPVYIK